MKLIKPYFSIVDEIDGMGILKKLEKIARVCYKSEEKITDDSCFKFIENIIKRGHEAIIEHVNVTVKVVCDRGVSHEIVRHRIASYAQESTRYCNYKGGVTFIIPLWLNDCIPEGEYITFANDALHKVLPDDAACWWAYMLSCEANYKSLLSKGWTPQQARSVLPNSTKTEIVMTMNLRELRHFFKLRASVSAHPQAQEIAYSILLKFKQLVPVIFDDIPMDYNGSLIECK